MAVSGHWALSLSITPWPTFCILPVWLTAASLAKRSRSCTATRTCRYRIWPNFGCTFLSIATRYILDQTEKRTNSFAVFFISESILAWLGQIEETLERIDLSLVMELWFSDQGYATGLSSDSHDRSSNASNGAGIACVSTRTLQLNFSPTRGLHYHLPVLFDYFHLAAVTVSVHASLIAIRQPCIK